SARVLHTGLERKRPYSTGLCQSPWRAGAGTRWRGVDLQGRGRRIRLRQPFPVIAVDPFDDNVVLAGAQQLLARDWTREGVQHADRVVSRRHPACTPVGQDMRRTFQTEPAERTVSQ